MEVLNFVTSKRRTKSRVLAGYDPPFLFHPACNYSYGSSFELISVIYTCVKTLRTFRALLLVIPRCVCQLFPINNTEIPSKPIFHDLIVRIRRDVRENSKNQRISMDTRCLWSYTYVDVVLHACCCLSLH